MCELWGTEDSPVLESDCTPPPSFPDPYGFLLVIFFLKGTTKNTALQRYGVTKRNVALSHILKL